MENELCKVCNKREVHGYVRGTGEFLIDTCLICRRKKNRQDNFYETGSSRRTNTFHHQGKEDK